MASFAAASDFEKAAEYVKVAKATNGKSASNEQKLKLYALFKQVNKGDVTGSQPWAVQLEARAKWDAHAAVKGMAAEEAKAKYVAEVLAQREEFALVCEGVDWPSTSAAGKKVLLVATSATELAGDATGAWLEEIAGPYKVFTDAKAVVSFASIAGGAIPIDAGSKGEGFYTEDCKALDANADATAAMKASAKLADVDVTAYDAVFFAGGHGTCVDFVDGVAPEAASKAYAAGMVVAAVCHGPNALVNSKDGAGAALVKGKRVAAFTDVEEAQVQKTDKVPFLLEAKLRELGCEFVVADPWTSNAVRDGKLVTGQNPQSSVACAKLVLEAL